MGHRARVAVYADADADAPFVREADEAVRSAGTGRDYLDVDAIVAAARATGADAVHPGYGFLSENAAFARAVVDAGLVWVGPSPEAIAAMGDKIAAKQAAWRGRRADASPARRTIAGDCAAERSAIPLLVKAAAGGGGKGMRSSRGRTR